MELTNEQIVTNMLSQKEILKHRENCEYNTNLNYNLGEFLLKEKNAPSKWGDKYIFVK